MTENVARFIGPTRQNPSVNFEGSGREAPNFVAEVHANIELGAVETLPAGSNAYVLNVGTPIHQIWNIGIPQGIQGENASIIIRIL